jgi:hypothetical protein
VNKVEAKSEPLIVVEKAEFGRHPEDVIASNGHPVALAGPIGEPQGAKRIGIAKGVLEVPDIIDEHNEDIGQHFLS